MKTIMKVDELKTINQLQNFLDGTQVVAFSVESNKDNQYAWIQGMLARFNYPGLNKRAKGIVRQFVMRITGYSRAQVARLINQFQQSGAVVCLRRNTHGFKSKYTQADLRLLAHLDELHGTLSGHATKKLCERAYHNFRQIEYGRLALISVSHLYNLRGSKSYKNLRWKYEKTRPKASTIGERRKPVTNGEPGHIRIDTVHQGDFDKQKGVYHINAVDEVTQFEVVCTVEKISEQYLIPVLETLINTFPFIIKGIHSDNGSEYVNKVVEKLLNKLLIEFTKSRPRHSNDNALAECKNGAIVRKHLGYSHIPQYWAAQVNELNNTYLNPYINYHRPCFFPEIKIDAKGKQKKTYPYKKMMTPYEKFKSLENGKQYLKPGLSFKELEQMANQMNDNDAAKQLQKARNKLFQIIFEQKVG
jgi:transposase InsO family protein